MPVASSSSSTTPRIANGSPTSAPGSQPDPNPSHTDPSSNIGSPSRSSVPVGVILGPILGAIALMLVVVGAYLYLKKRRKQQQAAEETQQASSTPLRPFRMHDHDHDPGPTTPLTSNHPMAIITRQEHKSKRDFFEVETNLLSPMAHTNPGATPSPLITPDIDRNFRPEKSPRSPGPQSPIQQLWTPSLASPKINTPTSPNLLARVRRAYASISWHTSASAAPSNSNGAYSAREDSDVLPRYESMIMSRRSRTEHDSVHVYD
ncbi:hypothetical protein CVT24_007568 [Panaeolus cyanescens]|uniref:Uncharacterized protein n=1 Tax=Panaeolus cyanescens TaxID=181874 RepID=A0A409YWL9_9AGAR|nr:hypothetical protein CVT24_007568 [Panaeolus cyanescens]